MLNSVAKSGRDWTVLYYGGAVNNLEADIRKAWTNLEGQDLPDNLDTFVRHIDQDGHMEDIHLASDGTTNVLASIRDEVDSSDPEVLSDFFRQGVSKFPARKYLVVLSSHGRGAEGVVEDDRQEAIMRPHEVKAAFDAGKEANNGRPLDVVLFDACRMAAVEMATELAGSALISVASMDSIAGMGYDLNEVLNAAAASEDARELGQRLVHNPQSEQLDTLNSISAVDLSQMEKFTKAMAGMAKEIRGLDPDALAVVSEHAQHSRRNKPSPISEYGNDLLADSILNSPNGDNASALELWLENERPGDSVSIVSFCNRLLSDEELMKRCPELGDSIVNVVWAHDEIVYAYRSQDTEEDPGGLTVALPVKNKIGPLYDSELVFEESSGWEAAYNSVLPEGEHFEKEPTWLEQKLDQKGSQVDD